MVFSYNWLQSFFQKKLPKPEKLTELLTMHSFEVAGVKRASKDYVLDIDVLPNRGPDCFSHLGIARECAALMSLKLKTQNLKLKEDKKLRTKDFIKIEVKDKTDCSRYTARVITNVKVGFSPKWIQKRLKVCGLRPINNIVDIANYVMLETGQPLHAFDLDKISGMKIPNPKSQIPNKSKIQNPKIKTIIVRRTKKGEKIITLDNEKYNLDEDILVIADSKEPLAIAGIKGGKKAEIDKKTRTVVLESANFNSRVVRKGSKILDLKTDASWRFEHGIDPNLTEIAINRAADLIQKEARGKITSGLVDFYPKKVLPKKITLSYIYLTKLLGVKIEREEAKEVLTRLGFKIVKEKHPFLTVEVPTFRLDISLPEDLIEEIGRIYGYQKIPAFFPIVSLIPPKRNFQIFWENIIKNILKELGFTEVYNYSFIGGKEAKIFRYKDSEIVEIENPTSKEFRYLRPSLVLNLLKNIKSNFKYLPVSSLSRRRWQAGYDKIQIFELGKIFLKDQKRRKVLEKKMLSGGLASKRISSKADEFYCLKGTIDSLFNKLGISDIWYDSYQPSPEQSKLTIWQPKKCAEIKISQEEIGFLGEISPSILKDLDIKGKIVLFDLDFERIANLCSEEHEYQPISQYPAAVRDLAVLVPRGVKVVEVLNKIGSISGSLVRDVDLFDIYEGEELPRGKKNLAFHIIYQAEDRTLKSGEIDKIQQKIIKVLEENPEWEVRK